jgi:hypothetical protein
VKVPWVLYVNASLVVPTILPLESSVAVGAAEIVAEH